MATLHRSQPLEHKQVTDRESKPGAAERSFFISLQGDHALTVSELWPDGDAPENPTVKDVVDLLQRYSIVDLMGDWNLGVDVNVALAGHARGGGADDSPVWLTSYGTSDKLSRLKT